MKFNSDSDIAYQTPPKQRISGSSLGTIGWYSNYKDPQRFTSIQDLRDLFGEIARHDDVSDIVIKSGDPVTIKSKRLGLTAASHRCLSHTEVMFISEKLTNEPAISTQINSGIPISGQANIIDIAGYDERTGSQKGKLRYRYEITSCSSVEERMGVCIVMRPLPDEPYRYTDLGLPLSFVNSFIVNNGLVIVAGATGEGKSTTLSSVTRYILENDTLIKGIIISHEDPIEVDYSGIKSKHSRVYQSQIGEGQNIKSFSLANVSAMRRSPDLAILGELRDAETVENAIEMSLTGHPIFATTHSTDVGSIFPRLISRFPKEQQSQKGFDLVENTRFLVAQKLIRTVDNKRLAVRETLEFTAGLRAELMRYAEKPDQLYNIIKGIMKNEDFGAVSYRSQADRLLEQGIIDEVNYYHLVGNLIELNSVEVQTIKDYAHG